jgi:hypothetical protein
MLSLAGRGAGAALQKAITLSKTLMDMSGEGTATDAYKAAKALGYGPEDILRNAAAKEAIRAATSNADAYLAQTGDHQGALRVYAGSIDRSERLAGAGKKLTSGIGLATGALDYAKKTSALADLIQEYLDHDADATRAQGQMDDVNERMRDLQLRIDDARRRCEASRRSSQLLPPGNGVVFASSHAPLLLLPAQQASPPTGDAAAIATRLRSSATQLEEVPAQFEEAAVWLLPFLAETTDGVSPGLLAALYGEASKHFESIQRALDDASPDQQSFQRQLETAMPKPKASTPTTPSKPRS